MPLINYCTFQEGLTDPKYTDFLVNFRLWLSNYWNFPMRHCSTVPHLTGPILQSAWVQWVWPNPSTFRDGFVEPINSLGCSKKVQCFLRCFFSYLSLYRKEWLIIHYCANGNQSEFLKSQQSIRDVSPVRLEWQDAVTQKRGTLFSQMLFLLICLIQTRMVENTLLCNLESEGISEKSTMCQWCFTCTFRMAACSNTQVQYVVFSDVVFSYFSLYRQEWLKAHYCAI